MRDYHFKTQPYEHQLKAFELCKDAVEFALLMEQGTGKTKVALDKACYNYCNGEINGVLIVAPNGVHANWVRNEIPKHAPDYIKYNCLQWANTSRFKDKFDQLIDTQKLMFFSINVEALATDKGKEYVKKFLTLTNTLFILDESSRIKTPSALRTKAAINLGKLAKQRLIMTGTPVTQSPFDLYAQFKFLNPEILGNQTYTAFKHEYGNFQRRINSTTGYAFEIVESYKNLDQLTNYIAPYSYRVVKDECLDLPDKIYQRYPIELSAGQRAYYNKLREELIVEIGEVQIVTPIVLTKLLRLQQIVGGYLPMQDYSETGQVIPIEEENTRLKYLLNIIDSLDGKMIIWARFRAENRAIVDSLRKIYGYDSVAGIWSEASSDERMANVDQFQLNPDCRFFVANQKAGGIGLTLTAATTVIYYSNDFSLETRLQSEDRAHRIGQKNHVVYIDIEAIDTIDSTVINALRDKKNIADLITGDKVRQWL